MYIGYNNINNSIVKKADTIMEVFENISIQKNISLYGGIHLDYLIISYQSTIDISFETIGPDSNINIFCILIGENNIHNKGNFVCNINHSNCKVIMHTLSFLLNQSDVELNGGININTDVIHAEGYLLEENIILGKNIKIKTLPLLDIHSNNIKSSHGAKVHRLDPQKLFYIQSKGLSSIQSRKLIVEGYINKIFRSFENKEKIEVTSIKNTLLERLLTQK